MPFWGSPSSPYTRSDAAALQEGAAQDSSRRKTRSIGLLSGAGTQSSVWIASPDCMGEDGPRCKILGGLVCPRTRRLAQEVKALFSYRRSDCKILMHCKEQAALETH